MHLFQDCGFGDGGEHVCIPCDDGTFSSDTDVAPCRRCTQCSLLNRHLVTACSPTRDGLCGQCLPGSAPLGSTNCIYTCCVVFSRMNVCGCRYYEVRSMIGEAELLCLPCFSRDAVHEECLLLVTQESKPRMTHRLTPQLNISMLKQQL